MDFNQAPKLMGRKNVISGSFGLCMLCNICVVSITVTTPLGEKLQRNTKFVGSDSSNYLLLKLPSDDSTTVKHYFQEGFYLNVKIAARRGEGLIACFRTTIKNVILHPIALLVIDIPETMTLHQLRSEPRYEVDMLANIITKGKKLNVTIKDISNGGCCFEADRQAPKLENNESLVIKVTDKVTNSNITLTGKVSNLREGNKVNSYGIMFDSKCKDQVENLLSQLTLKGSTISNNKKTSQI